MVNSEKKLPRTVSCIYFFSEQRNLPSPFKRRYKSKAWYFSYLKIVTAFEIIYRILRKIIAPAQVYRFQRLSWLTKVSEKLKRLKNFIDSGLISSLFIYIRNLFYCSLIFAAGSYAQHHPPPFIKDTFLSPISGYPLIIIGIILMLLNLLDSVKHMNKLNISKALKTYVFIFHVFVTLCLVIVLWQYRIK